MSDEQKPDLKVVQPAQNSPDTKEKWQYVRQAYIYELKSVKAISEESGIPESTLYYRIKGEGWDQERELRENLARKVADSVAFLMNPDTETKAIAEGNLRVLLQIQGVQLANAQRNVLNGDIHLGLTDMIQKYAGALEKLITAKHKLENDGIERSEVVHVHQVDMDDALRLVLEAKKHGKVISVGDAANALAEQQKKAKEDGKSS